MDAWAAWVAVELPMLDAEGRARALAAAQGVLDRGGTPLDAALAARLASLEPRGPLTADAIAEARAQVEAQRVAAAQLRAQPPPVPPPPHPSPAPAAGPSLRELFSENSVLLLGMTGAFLLVVATVLFELYGASQLGGWVRFGAVAGLAASFGLAAWICLGSRRLRVVGQVYLAVFALLVPLAAVAAYTFLDLGRQGVTIPTAVALSGLACALLYAVLALRLDAAAYAWLAGAALLIAWAGGADALFGQPWAGPAAAVLVAAYALLAAAGPRLFRAPALAMVHAPWVPALVLTLGERRPAVVTLLLVAAGYAAHALLQRRAGWLLASAAALTAALAWLDSGQDWGWEVAAAQFVVVGAALAAISWWAPGVGRLSGSWLRIAAGAEVGLATLLWPRHALFQAAVLLAGLSLLLLMARRQRSHWWLAAATPVLAMAWYWAAAGLLTPPAHPTTASLAQVFLPLPALVGGAGILLRRWRGPAWGNALAAPAALGGLLVAFLAAGANDYQLAGVALVLYGVLAYLAGALARSATEVASALLAVAAGVLALLASRSAPAAAYVLVTAALAASISALQLAWRGVTALMQVHRAVGLAGLALMVLVDLGDIEFYARHGSGDLAAAAAALVLAAMLALDAYLHRFALGDYGALVVTGLAGVWLAGWLGAADALWYALGPGLGLLAGGLYMPHDRRLPRRPLLDRMLVAAGALTLLGPEAAQTLQADEGAAVHLTRLLAGGLAGLLVGIAARSRVLVVAASVAVLLAALRALFVVLESVQPYLLFGALALLLLAGAALLAGLRDRVGGARSALTSSWSGWS